MKELEQLNSDIRRLVVDLSTLTDKVKISHYDLVRENVAGKLCSFRARLVDAAKSCILHTKHSESAPRRG